MDIQQKRAIVVARLSYRFMPEPSFKMMDLEEISELENMTLDLCKAFKDDPEESMLMDRLRLRAKIRRISLSVDFITSAKDKVCFHPYLLRQQSENAIDKMLSMAQKGIDIARKCRFHKSFEFFNAAMFALLIEKIERSHKRDKAIHGQGIGYETTLDLKR